MLIFGIIGLAANVIGILVLAEVAPPTSTCARRSSKVLNDALDSLGVIVAAIVIKTTGFMRPMQLRPSSSPRSSFLGPSS